MQMCVFSFLYVRLLCFIDSSVLIATLGGGDWGKGLDKLVRLLEFLECLKILFSSWKLLEF